MAGTNVELVIKAVDEASRQIKAVRGELDKLERQTRQNASAFARLKRSYDQALGPSRAVMGATIGLGTALLGAAGYALKLAGDMEQTKVAFTTLIGNAQDADRFLSDLADTASRTPFNLPGLQNASRLLLAFGFEADQTIPIVETLGDAVSAMGGSTAELQGVVRAIGQIQAKGKVSAEELMQLAERGIPAYQILQEELGLTGEQVANIGNEGISAAEGINALLVGMSDRFGGAMEQQAQTMLGLLSNVRDETTRIAITIGTELAEALNIKPALNSAIETLGQLRERIDNVGLKAVLRDISDQAIVAAGALTGALLPAMINLAIVVGRATLRLAPWVLVGALVADTARRMGTELDDVLPAIRRIGLAFSGIVDITMAVGSAVAQLVADGVAAIRVYMRSADQFMALLANTGDAIAHGAGPRQLANLWSDGFDSINEDVRTGLDEILNDSTDTWLEIGNRLDQGWADLTTSATGSADEVAAAFSGADPVIDAVAESVESLADLLTGGLTEGLLDVADGVTAVGEAAEEAASGPAPWSVEGMIRRNTYAGQGQVPGGARNASAGPIDIDAMLKPDPWLEALFAPGGITDRLNHAPVALDWKEKRDAAWMEALLGSGRGMTGLTDNTWRLSMVFTPAELRDQAWMDALMSGGGASDQLTNLPMRLDWKDERDRDWLAALMGGDSGDGYGIGIMVGGPSAAEIKRSRQDDVIFGALGDYNPAMRTGSQYGERGVIPTADEIRAAQDAVIFGALGDYDPSQRTGSQYGERGSQTEPTEADGIFKQATDAVRSFGEGVLNAARDAVPALDAAITGFAQGGPLGALAGMFQALVMESEVFQNILAAVNRVFEPLAEALDTLLQALWPIIDVALALVSAALGPLVWIIEHIVAPVLTWLARIVAGIWNAIATVLNAILGWAGVNLRKIDIDGMVPEEQDDPPGTQSPPAGGGRQDPATTPFDATFGRSPQALQLAVATPLVEAADKMLAAANLIAAQFGGGGSGDLMERHATAMRDHTGVMRRWVDEGITINVATSGGNTSTRTAALR